MRQNIGDAIGRPAERRQAGQGIRQTQVAAADRSLPPQVGVNGRFLIPRAHGEDRLLVRGGRVHRESPFARHFDSQRPEGLVVAGGAFPAFGPGPGACLE
ncbi:MAG: hypothetical protein H0W08_05130 [Acidobacteria bacterium]|nr:hypothetical protein [Acidobacteriota bacterium]